MIKEKDLIINKKDLIIKKKDLIIIKIEKELNREFFFSRIFLIDREAYN